MDYPMSEDDPEGSAAMSNNQQNAARCPYRSPADGAGGSASAQPGWSHNPHFGGPHIAHMPMNAFYSPPNAHWVGSQAGQQVSHALRQPYVSHQARSSGSSTNSEYGSQEIRSHGQTQIHNQSRAQHMEDSRPHMPRVFSSPERLTSGSGQGAQSGQQQTANLTSSPNQNSIPNNAWSMQPYAMDNAGRTVNGYHPQFLQSLPRPPPFGGHPNFFLGQHPRQLPQPNFTANTNSTHSNPAGHLQMSQSGQPQRVAPFHAGFGMPIGNLPAHILPQDQHHRPAVPAIPYEDSDDDSEADDDDDDDDTDSSPPRMHERGAASRGLSRADARAAYLAVSEAEVLRERQRAARRAQLHNVKSIAHPDYIAGLEKVDLKTLGGEELTCMICYNEFGVKNPDGQTEVAVRLGKCKHILGENCLKKWFEDSDSCPYCRDKVPSIQKHRARLHRLAEEVGRPGSALINRYASMTAEERVAMVSHYAEHNGRFYGVYGDREMARSGGIPEPRTYTQAERDVLLQDLRDGQERLEGLLYQGAPPAEDRNRHAIPEYRDRYERILMQRHDENIAQNGNSGAAYATRTVPQYERRRQARVRAANNRGVVSINSGSTASTAGLRLPSMSDTPESSLQGGSRSANHSAHSSFDSNSSNGGLRSITPHPTILDATSSSINSTLNPTLNPAAPVWNGMRQSQQSQPQPNGPPSGHMAPDSPSRALFGYYQTNRASSTNPDNWRFPGNNNNNGSAEGAPAWQSAEQATGQAAGTLALARAMNEGLYNFGDVPMAGDEQWELRGSDPEVDMEMPDLNDPSF